MYIYIYFFVYVHTWNPNEPCFHWKGPSFGGFNFQNRGQTGSRYCYIYIYTPTLPKMNCYATVCWPETAFLLKALACLDVPGS